MKKGCIIASVVGLVFLAMIGGFVFFVFRLTAGPVDAANDFLALVGTGKSHAAYESASEAFKKATTEEAFNGFVKERGLESFESALWTSRKIENDQGTVEGSVKLKGGSSSHLAMLFSKGDGGWKLVSIEGQPTGIKVAGEEPKTTPEIPSDADAKKMCLASLMDFEEGLQAGGDFSKLLANSAEAFKKTFTSDGLKGQFKEFLEKKVTVAGAKDVEPAFDSPPAINSDGFLNLKGSYPTQPLVLAFDLKYMPDGGSWKLSGIAVNVKPK